MTVHNKSGHILSNSHKSRERFASTVKKDDFDNHENSQKDKTVRDVVKDCKAKSFHTFECRC